MDNTIESKYEGKLAFTELRTVEGVDEQGTAKTIVVSRMTELRIVDENTGMTYSQYDIPYGSTLYFKDGDAVKKGDLICEWDAYNATTIVESAGTIRFENMAEGVTYREENADEYSEYAIIYNTLQKDPTNTEIEAVNFIYKQLRNSEPPDESTARDVIDKLFFSEKRYDLGSVGRYRLNKKLSLTIDPGVRVLTNTDIIEIIKYLIQVILTLEDGALKGGLYSAVCEYFAGYTDAPIVKGLGIPDKFIAQDTQKAQWAECCLDTESIYGILVDLLKK